MQPKTIILLVVGIILLIFVFQNSDMVYFRFLFWRIHMPQIVMMPLLLVVGGVGGFVLAKVWRKR